MALVVEEHPIAGHTLKGIRKKVDAAFPAILKAATLWQPGNQATRETIMETGL